MDREIHHRIDGGRFMKSGVLYGRFFTAFRFHPAETYTGSTVFRDAFQ